MGTFWYRHIYFDRYRGLDINESLVYFSLSMLTGLLKTLTKELINSNVFFVKPTNGFGENGRTLDVRSVSAWPSF